MLKVNQILDLSKQGFTAEQIEYLNGLSQPETGGAPTHENSKPGTGGTPTHENSKPETGGTPTHENSKPPADQGTNTGDASPSASPATSATAPVDPSSGDAIKALTSQIAALSDTVKQMQAVNAHKAEQQIPQKVTADSIIKDFFGRKEGR